MAETGNLEKNNNGGQDKKPERTGNNYNRNKNRRHYDGNRYQGKPRNQREETDDRNSAEAKKPVEAKKPADNNNPQGQTNQNRNQNQKQPYWKNQNRNRYEKRIKAEETIEDIKKDCGRIESEITLEIKEIETLRLSL